MQFSLALIIMTENLVGATPAELLSSQRKRTKIRAEKQNKKGTRKGKIKRERHADVRRSEAGHMYFRFVSCSEVTETRLMLRTLLGKFTVPSSFTTQALCVKLLKLTV